MAAETSAPAVLAEYRAPGIRPLPNLDEIHKRRDDPVLVLQGAEPYECADGMLDRYVLTYFSAPSAVTKYDWEPLNDRRVVIWPDPTDAGYEAVSKLAGHLHGHAKTVEVVNGGSTLIDQLGDFSPIKVQAYIAENLKPVRPAMPPPRKSDRPPIPAVAELDALPPTQVFQPYLDADEARSVVVSWESLGLERANGGVPYATIDNASRIIQMHPRLRGKIWHDRFTYKTFQAFDGTPKEWTDSDDIDLTVFIQRHLKLPKFSLGLIKEAVEHAARRQSINSLTDWIDSLKWDREPRIDHWLSDYAGVERTEYSIAVGRNWLIAMVARAYEPGCQVDSMLVLEGPSGAGKSSLIKAMGGKWFRELRTRIDHKDFQEFLRGTWLLEFAEMSGFKNVRHDEAIGAITTKVDTYRASFGRRTQDVPRVTLFAGSCEHNQYLDEEAGVRKFWPVWCTEVNIPAFNKMRDQLFAEAVVRYRNKEPWHLMPEASKDEQMARIQRDVWTDKVMSFVEDQERNCALERRGTVFRISAADILDALGISNAQQGDGEKRRIGRILKKNGWVQTNTGVRLWRRLPVVSGQ